MKPQQLLDHINISDAMPPSQIILEAFRRNKGIPNEAIVQQLSKQVLLPVESPEDCAKQSSQRRKESCCYA
jgi:hypothetical protein